MTVGQTEEGEGGICVTVREELRGRTPVRGTEELSPDEIRRVPPYSPEKTDTGTRADLITPEGTNDDETNDSESGSVRPVSRPFSQPCMLILPAGPRTSTHLGASIELVFTT